MRPRWGQGGMPWIESSARWPQRSFCRSCMWVGQRTGSSHCRGALVVEPIALKLQHTLFAQWGDGAALFLVYMHVRSKRVNRLCCQPLATYSSWYIGSGWVRRWRQRSQILASFSQASDCNCCGRPVSQNHLAQFACGSCLCCATP